MEIVFVDFFLGDFMAIRSKSAMFFSVVFQIGGDLFPFCLVELADSTFARAMAAHG